MPPTKLPASIASGFLETGPRRDSVAPTFARTWVLRRFAHVLGNVAPVFELLVVAMLLLVAVPARCHSQQAANATTAATALTENPLAAEFKACDADGDGALTVAEYLTRVGREMPVLRREFKVFDFDGDGRMSLAEFITVPVGQPEE